MTSLPVPELAPQPIAYIAGTLDLLVGVFGAVGKEIALCVTFRHCEMTLLIGVSALVVAHVLVSAR